GAADVVHHLGGGDEGLRGHHIGEHGGAAAAVLLDEHDIGAELSRDECGLVAAGAAADDDDTICSGRKFWVHTAIVSNRPLTGKGAEVRGPDALRTERD